MWNELRKKVYTVWIISGPVVKSEEEKQVRNVEYWRATLREFQEREDSELAIQIHEAEVSRAIWLQVRTGASISDPTPAVYHSPPHSSDTVKSNNQEPKTEKVTESVSTSGMKISVDIANQSLDASIPDHIMSLPALSAANEKGKHERPFV